MIVQIETFNINDILLYDYLHEKGTGNTYKVISISKDKSKKYFELCDNQGNIVKRKMSVILCPDMFVLIRDIEIGF